MACNIKPCIAAQDSQPMSICKGKELNQLPKPPGHHKQLSLPEAEPADDLQHSYQLTGKVWPPKVECADNEGEEQNAESSADFTELLRDAPSPKLFPVFNFLFIMTFAGVSCGRRYPLNVLVALLILAGNIAGIFIYCRLMVQQELWQKLTHSGRQHNHKSSLKDIADTLDWVSVMLGWILVSTAFVVVAITLHTRYRATRVQDVSSICCIAERRDLARATMSKRRSTARSIVCRLHCADYLSFGALAAIVLLLADIFAINLRLTKLITSQTNPALQVIIHISGLWAQSATYVFMAYFYACLDDMVMVIDHVRRAAVRSKYVSRADPTQEQNVSTSSISMVKDLECYLDYVSRRLYLSKWLLVHIGALVLLILLRTVGELILIQDKQRPLAFLSGGREFIYCAPILVLLMLPVYSAGRVTSAWDRMVYDLQTSKDLARRDPAQHMHLSQFLGNCRGGFRVCGYRVEHYTSIKILLWIVTLSGIARLIHMK